MRRVRLGVLLLVGVVVQAAVLLGGAVQAEPASAATTSVLVLNAGQRRVGNQPVVNGAFRFEVSTNSLVVLQNGRLSGPRQFDIGLRCWEVNDTVHSSTPTTYLGLTNAGDLQLVAPGIGVLWHSNTAGRGGKHLMLTRTGNLVLYTADWKILWQSASGPCWQNANTLLPSGQSLRKGFIKDGKQAPWRVLTMQANGNLVLRFGSTVAWQTGTNVPGSYAALTTKGELLVRAPGGKVLWSSNRPASPDCACELEVGLNYGGQLSVRNLSSGSWATVWQATIRPPA